MPIAWKGNVEQYAVRLHREYAGKNEVRIYDYVDVHVTLCDSMYRIRLKGYLRAGYGKYVTSSTPVSYTHLSRSMYASSLLSEQVIALVGA